MVEYLQTPYREAQARILDGTVTVWSDFAFLAAEVNGGMGTVLAQRPDASVRDAWARFKADHGAAAGLVELSAGGWDTLRRHLNRIRPGLQHEAAAVWGVRPLPA